MKLKTKIFIGIGVVLLFAGMGGGVWYYLSHKGPQAPSLEDLNAKTDPEGFVGFNADTFDAVLPGTTSLYLDPHKDLHYALTLFAPNDPKGPRIQITDELMGTLCDTDHYLVERVYVADDEKTMRIYHRKDSTHYVDTVDLATCDTIAPTQVLQ